MNDTNTTEREALDHIGGRIVGASVIYYDDSTRRWYRNDRADIAYLRELMDDPETESDAYSHWCAVTTSDEYDTEEQAEIAARG